MIKVFIEGKGDKVFVNYLIKNHPGINKGHDFEIINTGGWTQLHNFKAKFEEVSDNSGESLVIFDADTDKNNGGFTKRKQDLENIKQTHNIEFKLFLFPNNSNDGDFEDLLELIINKKHSDLLTCFESFENCVSKLNTDAGEELYSLPAKKAKIYSYVTSLAQNQDELNKIKKLDYLYDKTELWDLKCKELDPLINFLNF